MVEHSHPDERPGIDPNHPAVFQRGFAEPIHPPLEGPSRRARRAREQLRVDQPRPTEALAAPDAGAPEPGAPEPMPMRTDPEPPRAEPGPVRARSLGILAAVAALLLVAGLAATWTGSSITYQQWNGQSGIPSVEDTVTASLLTTSGPALVTVGLAGLAAILVWLSVRGRR